MYLCNYRSSMKKESTGYGILVNKVKNNNNENNLTESEAT